MRVLFPFTVAVLIAASTAAAQTAPSPRFVVGGMGSWTVTSANNVAEGRTGSDFSVNLDVPLPHLLRARAEFGRSRFTFDGNSGLAEPQAPERIAFTRLTASAIRTIDVRRDLYVGLGFGLYRFTPDTVKSPGLNRAGFHVVAGSEIPIPAGGLAVRLEAQWQFVSGPDARENEPVPLSEGSHASPSRVGALGSPMNLIWGLGIGWRF